MNRESNFDQTSVQQSGDSSKNYPHVGVAGSGPVAGPFEAASDLENRNLGVTDTYLQRYLDHAVVDVNNDKVGTVDAIWDDGSGQPAYVGIKTGWLGFGKTHVVPADALEVSDSTRKIRLPYTAAFVKGAPSFEQQSDIDDDAERRISEYYAGYVPESSSRDMPAPLQTEKETGTADTSMRTTNEEVRMPLNSEEVKVGKREVEYGGVRLRKIVRTETVNQPVELQREEVVVERVPASERQPTRSDIAFREEEIYVPLRREEPVVEKTARTTEEVKVGKRRESERRDINETVRHEDVEIERQGDDVSRSR